MSSLRMRWSGWRISNNPIFSVLLSDEAGIWILVGLCTAGKSVTNRDTLSMLQEAGMPGFEIIYDEVPRE